MRGDDARAATTMLAVFQQNARNDPHAIFLRDLYLDQTLTYGQAAEAVRHIAGLLLEHQRGVSQSPSSSKPPLLALSFDCNDYFTILGTLAAWSIGWSVGLVSATETTPLELFAAQLQCLTPSLIIASGSQSYINLFSAARDAAFQATGLDNVVPSISLNDFLNVDQSKDVTLDWYEKMLSPADDRARGMEGPPDRHQEAYRLFTSSAINVSTVKAASLSHAVLHDNTFYWNRQDERLARRSHTLGLPPLSHSAGFQDQMCMSALATCGSYIFVEAAKEKNSLSRAMLGVRSMIEAGKRGIPCNAVWTIPIFVEAMTACTESAASDEESQEDRGLLLSTLKQLNYMIVVGAAVGNHLLDWASSHDIPLAVGWGMTEAQFGACVLPLGAAKETSRAMSMNKEIFSHIDDGQLLLKGKAIMSGYWRVDPKGGRAYFDSVDDAFETGDNFSLLSAETSKEGGSDAILVEYLGRVDDTIQLVNGEKALATEIEASLASTSAIRQAYVTGNSTSPDRPSASLVALVELNSGGSQGEEELAKSLGSANERLAPASRIALQNVKVVASLPTTTKGLPFRKRIRQDFAEDILDLQSACAGRIALETLDSTLKLDCAAAKSQSLTSLALSSIQAARLVKVIETMTGVAISVVELIELDTVGDLESLVVTKMRNPPSPAEGSTSSRSTGSTSRRPSVLTSALERRPPRVERKQGTAIRGIGLRLPGNIRCKKDAWNAFSTLRGPKGEEILSLPPKGRKFHDKILANTFGGWLSEDDVKSFDPRFFGIDESEAIYVKPQQRLALEVAYEALEDALIVPSSLRGQQVGIFCAASGDDGYDLLLRQEENESRQSSRFWGHGTHQAALAGRLAHYLGTEGPVMTIETACSGGLVAMYSAIRALDAGDCDIALVGGITTHFDAAHFEFMQGANMTTKQGHSQAFGSEADGMMASEGVVFMVLQRQIETPPSLSQAVVQHVATQHQGVSSNMLMTRSDAQARLMGKTIQRAGIDASDIDLIETHGTGTKLGDAVEARALMTVFQDKGRRGAEPVIVSSSKTVFGHTEEASGLVGLLKAMLVMQHRACPPHQVAKTEDSFSWPDMDAVIPRKEVRLDGRSAPLHAVVSSFGFSGIMACAVIEGPHESALTDIDDQASSTSLPPIGLLLLSAPDDVRLRRLAEASIDWLKDATRQVAGREVLSTLMSTINSGRDSFPTRRAVSFEPDDHWSLMEKLQQMCSSTVSPIKASVTRKRILVQFSGIGKLDVNVARDLFEKDESFRSAFQEAAREMAKWTELNLEQVLYPPSEAYVDESVQALESTTTAQACQFVLSYALWHSVRPYIIPSNEVSFIGHSFGEVVAATAAGVLSLADAAQLIHTRSLVCAETWSSASPGAMLGVRCSLKKIESMLPESVVVAAVNDMEALTLSGPKADIEELQRRLQVIGIPARRLNSQHIAFHHPRLAKHLSQMEELPFCRTNIDGISNFKSCSSSDGKTLDWARHLTDRVEYQRTVDHLCTSWRPHQIVEIGPASELTGLLKRRCKSGSMPGSAPLLTSICDSPGRAQLGDMLGSLFEAGSVISWPFALQRGGLRTTVFDRKPFWPGKQVAPKPRGGILVETPYTPDSVGSPNPAFEASNTSLKRRRPLLGKMNRGTHPTLAQHIVRGKAILPLAGFVEAALEESQDVLAIQNLEVHQAFELLEEGHDAELSIDKKEDDDEANRFAFTYVSANNDGVPLGSFTKLADGTAPTNEKVVDMVTPKKTTAIDLGRFFSGAWKDFAAFGPAFQRIKELKFDDKRVWCDIRNWEAKEGDEEERERYHIHPALLDAFFQSASALFVGDGSLTPGEYLLPVSVASFHLLRPMPDNHESATLKGQIELVEWRRDDFSADIYAFDQAGVPLFICRGLKLMVMRGSPRESSLEGGIKEETTTYKTIWQPASAPLSDPCEQASMIPDAVIPELGTTLGAQLDAHVTKLVYGARDRVKQISMEKKDMPLHLGRYKQLLEDLIKDYEEGKTTEVDTSLLREREPVLLEAAERICSVLDQALVDPTTALEVLLAGEFGQQLYSAGWRSDLQEFAEGKIRDELRRLASSEKQVIRLIEVGAGTGALSRSIARVAQQVEEETGKIIHCTFSDISPSLASRLVDSLRSSTSEDKPTRFSWMQYDFDEEAWKQTADLASYDVVLSFSALHAAQKIGSCLSQLQRLLCPGGTMMTFDLDGRAFEQDWPTTRFLNVLTGSLRGWFGFVDDDRKSHCTLSPAGWRDMLAKSGYTSVNTLSNISKGPEPYLYISARRRLLDSDHKAGSSSFRFSLGKEMQLKEHLEGMPGWHQQTSEGGSTCDIITACSQDFSAASGVARALRNERPWLRVRVIEAPLGSDVSTQSLEMESRIDENGVTLVPRIVADTSPERTRPSLDKCKNYLLAGGLTGLGLEVAFWLYTLGARHFVLTSRSGKLQKVEEDKIGHFKATRNLALLQSMPGVTVLTASCDASSKEQTRNLLDRLPTNIPLGGVVLMSAVMDARLFEKQDWSSFDSLYRSKVTPINLMKDVVDVDRLGFLLYFSTFGALMGLSGQSNYYAASLAGEAAIAELPNAASISVPAITDVGGFRLELTSQRKKTSASRIKSIFTTSNGFFSQIEGALSRALRRERPATLIPHVDWEGLGKELKELSMGVDPSMQHLTSLHRFKARGGEEETARKEDGRQEDYSVEALVAAAVQMDPAEIDASVPISFYGLDSLDATLLSGKMQQYHGVTVSQLRLLSDLTLQQVHDIVDKHGTKPVGNSSRGDRPTEVEEEEAIMVRPGTEPDRSPLFIIHDVMGQTALFRNIDETLTRPLWALQPTTRSKAEKDLIGVAKVYLESIRRVRPQVDREGLRIVSYSGSATIALHMAKIQQDAGHKVEQLTLIDYATPLLRLFRRESKFLHPKSHLAEGKKLSIKQLRLRGLLAVERAAEMDSALAGHHKRQISDLVQELVSLAEDDCQGRQSKDSSMRPILDDMPKYFNAIVGEVSEGREGEEEDADLQEAYRLWSSLQCDITLVLAEHGILPALRSLLPSDSPMQTDRYADLGLSAALGNEVKIDTHHIPQSGHFSILFSPALASLLER